jgi:HJR/Mrr/RecB family endonuclease
MDKWKLPKRCVAGIAEGRVDAFNSVLLIARKIATAQMHYSPRCIGDLEDLVQEALVDAVEAIRSGKCLSEDQVVKVVQRSVWRNAKREDRHRLRHVPLEAVPEPVSEGGLDRQTGYGRDSLFQAQLLFTWKKAKQQEAGSKADLIIVNDELIRHLKNHPHKMHELKPRQFEELVAAILRDLGYDVDLTAQSVDGGIDIIATRKSEVGEILLVVECKRYAERRPVGVGIVRALYGVGEQLRATMAMLATTSFFTRAAREFERMLRNRLTLKDFNDLVGWLREYGLRNESNHPSI